MYLRSAVFRISPLEPFALIECFAKKLMIFCFLENRMPKLLLSHSLSDIVAWRKSRALVDCKSALITLSWRGWGICSRSMRALKSKNSPSFWTKDLACVRSICVGSPMVLMWWRVKNAAIASKALSNWLIDEHKADICIALPR